MKNEDIPSIKIGRSNKVGMFPHKDACSDSPLLITFMDKIIDNVDAIIGGT